MRGTDKMWYPIADERQERIGKLLTKTPVVKRQLSFLGPAGINRGRKLPQ